MTPKRLAILAPLIALLLPATGCGGGGSLAQTPQIDVSAQRPLPEGSSPEMAKIKYKKPRVVSDRREAPPS